MRPLLPASSSRASAACPDPRPLAAQTTSAGIMDHEEARRKHVAGKVLGFGASLSRSASSRRAALTSPSSLARSLLSASSSRDAREHGVSGPRAAPPVRACVGSAKRCNARGIRSCLPAVVVVESERGRARGERLSPASPASPKSARATRACLSEERLDGRARERAPTCSSARRGGGAPLARFNTSHAHQLPCRAA